MINIDGKEFALESLTEEAKGQLASIAYIDSELKRMEAQIAVLKTARMAYSRGLQEQLNPLSGDTIKFS